jgi:hypothetical protein
MRDSTRVAHLPLTCILCAASVPSVPLWFSAARIPAAVMPPSPEKCQRTSRSVVSLGARFHSTGDARPTAFEISLDSGDRLAHSSRLIGSARSM